MTRSGPDPADVVVIGLGAAGGIAAHVLTEAGLEVVALEAGPRFSSAEMRLDEIRNEHRAWMSQAKAVHEVPTWRTDADQPAAASPWPMVMVNGVGGSSMHYEAVSLRLQPWNFASRGKTLERYGATAIPEESTLADWPLTYDDLEPFYVRSEQTLGVSGSPSSADDGARPSGNFFEGPRTRPYPMPPLRRTGWSDLMEEAGGRLGWHPYPAPAAVNSEPYQGRQACTYCGYCQNNGCHVDAKGATAVNVVPRAESTGLLRIETSARVTGLHVDTRGVVSGVHYVQHGRSVFQPAKAVLLASFTYENTRLLLLSRSKAFPRGVANNADQVGRHFIAHVTPTVFGFFPGTDLNLFSGTVAQGTCVDDWNADNFDHTDLGFIGGGMLLSLGEMRPVAAAGGGLVPPRVGRWGSAWKRWLRDNARSVGAAVAQFDALPYDGNHLDLDPVATDRFGLPVIRVTHRVRDHEVRGAQFLADKLKSWLLEAGAAEVWAWRPLLVEGRHAYGGTRMGDDPYSSVVDGFGFCHEAPNLGILGASTFPTAGGHNPTLTVQALAWRTAEHLARNWGAIATERTGEAA